MSTLSLLRRGDLFFVTPQEFKGEFHDELFSDDSLLKDDVALYSFDKATLGTHTLRNYMRLPLTEALSKTAQLLHKSRRLSLVLLASLVEDVAIGLSKLDNHEVVSDFEDIIIALLPGRILEIASKLEEKNEDISLAIKERFKELNSGVDENGYGYLLNVLAHNIIQSWANMGLATSNTSIINEIDSVDLNILILDREVNWECFQESKMDPLLPALELLIDDYSKSSNNTCLIHISKDLKARLSPLKINTSILVEGGMTEDVAKIA